MQSTKINYPYLPKGRKILYVPADDVFMQLAKAFARAQSLDENMPGAAVIVKVGRVIGIGANGSDYHKKQKCERVIRGCKSGEGYELCEGCHPKNHSEAKAISNARLGFGWSWYSNKFLSGADLYLWGHWWCCQSCWERMIFADISNVYLTDNSWTLFNKENPDNIVGRQFQ
ncbi:MAG: hypothetical protein AAB885_00595 [Patescibacteria group bacterium]